jgi:hypothetical protein
MRHEASVVDDDVDSAVTLDNGVQDDAQVRVRTLRRQALQAAERSRPAVGIADTQDDPERPVRDDLPIQAGTPRNSLCIQAFAMRGVAHIAHRDRLRLPAQPRDR